MSYAKLVELKYGKGIATHELARKFPGEVSRVSEVALLDIPKNTLKKVILEEEVFNRVMMLKKRFRLDVKKKC